MGVTDDLTSNNFAADGVLGIGFQGNSWSGPSIVSNLFTQGKVTHSVLALKLTESDSQLNIGGLDTKLYTGSPYYTPISSPGYWQITFYSLRIGTTSIPGGPAFMRSVRLESTLLFFLLSCLHCYSSC